MVGWNGNPIMAQSFVMFLMLCLAFCYLVNKINKWLSFFRSPYFWIKGLWRFITAFCWSRERITRKNINELSNNWNRSIKIDNKRSTHKRNRVSKVCDLPLCFWGDISIPDSCSCYNKLVKSHIVLRNRSLGVSQSPQFIAHQRKPQEEIFSQGVSK